MKRPISILVNTHTDSEKLSIRPLMTFEGGDIHMSIMNRKFIIKIVCYNTHNGFGKAIYKKNK